MINQEPIESEIFADIGRPSIFSDRDHIFWRKVHSYIKECDIPMSVSSAFWMVEEILTKPDSRYGGGGFKYCFWFNNENDKDRFLKDINAIEY
jgi:hypothetical protein